MAKIPIDMAANIFIIPNIFIISLENHENSIIFTQIFIEKKPSKMKHAEINPNIS